MSLSRQVAGVKDHLLEGRKKKQLLFTEDKLADNEVSCGGKSGLVGSMLLESVQRRCHAALNQLSHRTMQALYHSVAPDLSNFYGPLKS